MSYGDGIFEAATLFFFSLFIFITVCIFSSFDIYYILSSNTLSLFDITKLVICFLIVLMFLYMVMSLKSERQIKLDIVLNVIFQFIIIGLFILLLLEFSKVGFGFWHFFKTFCVGYCVWINYKNYYLEFVECLV